MSDKIIKSNSLFEQLCVFVGDWEMEAINNGIPHIKPRANFKWSENHTFMIQHSETEPCCQQLHMYG